MTLKENQFLNITHRQALTSIRPQKADEFKPGAILYSQWGIGHTSVDFYCVVNMIDTKTVVAIPMTSNVTEGEFENEVLPCEINKDGVIFSRVTKKDTGTEQYLQGFLGEFERIKLWDGEAKKCTKPAADE